MAGGGSAIRAGRAFVELFADSNQLYRALEGAKRRVLDFAKTTAKIGAGIGAAGSAIFAPLAKFFTDAVNDAASVDMLAKRLGSTAENISVLRGAFAQAGVSSEEFGSSMESLSQKISHAADSRDELISGLTGLRGDFLLGKGLDEQLDLIAEKIKNIPLAVDQLRVASELGLGGMVEVLKKGKAGLDAMRQAAIANGDALSSDDAKTATEIQKEYNRTLLAIKSTLLSVGKALLPAGKDIAAFGADIRSALTTARDWIVQNKGVITTVAAVAGAMVAGGAAIAAFGGAVALIAPAIGGLITALGVLKVAFLAVASVSGLWVAAFATIGAGLIYLVSRTQFAKDAWADFKGSVADAADFIKGSWKGVTDALSAGDFSLAWAIVVKSAEVAWDTFIVKLTTTWIGFKVVFVDTWEEATGFLAKAFVTVAATIEKILSGIIGNVVKMWNDVAGEIDSSLKITVPGLRSSDEIDKEKKDTIAAIDEITAAEKKRRFEARVGELGAAKADLDKAKAELEELKKTAADEAGKQYGGLFDRIGGLAKNKKKDESGGLPSVTQLFANQKGIFGGNAAQQLGVGDQTAQRNLEANLGTQTATAAMAKYLEEIKNRPPGDWN